MKEKFITFPKDHRILSNDELRGKAYCKYHNSWNHTTNACWGFINVIQDRINKGILKFPDKKKKTMAIDEDHFPLVASVNTTSLDLRAFIESKKTGKLSPRKLWVPKYCPVHVDRLKKDWATVCTDPLSRRNSVKGIQQGIEQHNRFSKKMKLLQKGKTNSQEEFVPHREKVVERPTPPWGRFISPRENDVGKFRECSSRKRVFSPRGKFTPLNGKIAGKDNSPRKKARERHVYPLM